MFVFPVGPAASLPRGAHPRVVSHSQPLPGGTLEMFGGILCVLGGVIMQWWWWWWWETGDGTAAVSWAGIQGIWLCGQQPNMKKSGPTPNASAPWEPQCCLNSNCLSSFLIIFNICAITSLIFFLCINSLLKNSFTLSHSVF